MDKLSELIDKFMEAQSQLKLEHKRELSVLLAKTLEENYMLLVPTEFNINFATSFSLAFPGSTSSIPQTNPKKRRERTPIVTEIFQTIQTDDSIEDKKQNVTKVLKDNLVIIKRDSQIKEYLDIIKMTNKIANNRTVTPRSASIVYGKPESRLSLIGQFIFKEINSSNINFRNISIHGMDENNPTINIYSYKKFDYKNFLELNRKQINKVFDDHNIELKNSIQIILSLDAKTSIEINEPVVMTPASLSMEDKYFFFAFGLQVQFSKNQSNLRNLISIEDITFECIFNSIINKLTKIKETV